MATQSEKRPSPPYVSYSSFKSFISGLGESTVPSRVDKTVMSNYSGSTQYALLPALQWCGLIEKDGTPSELLHNLANAKDDDFGKLLKPMAEEKYDFLFNKNVKLETASSGQVIEAFKAQDITGTTVTRCMSFFLALAKDAGITVSSHVKPPIVPRKKATQKNNKNQQGDTAEEAKNKHNPPPPKDMVRIPVPLKDMDDGEILFPTGLSDEQARKAVKMAVFILNNFYEIDD